LPGWLEPIRVLPDRTIIVPGCYPVNDIGAALPTPRRVADDEEWAARRTQTITVTVMILVPHADTGVFA
jgi:hypothetical protein